MKKFLMILVLCLISYNAQAKYILINSNDDTDITNMLTIATHLGCELKGTMFAQGNRFYHMTDCEPYFDYDKFKSVYKKHRQDLHDGKIQLPRDIGMFIVEINNSRR